MNTKALLACAIAAACGTASAQDILVTINGDVYGNQINNGTLSAVSPGETAAYSFLINASNYNDDPSFPTRGYEIDLSSFQVAFSGGTTIGLDPAFTGPAYFVVRESDPVADGFFISSNSTGFPADMPLAHAGVFDQFAARFSVSYTGDTLTTLDILDAVGTYDYDGLTVFGMGINDGPIEGVLGIDFASMTIEIVPAPASAAMLGFGGLVAARRRRS